MKKLLYLSILILITLCFNGCGWGWFVPYSFQPSYHKFKEKANGGKLDEEYYNKALKYFDTNIDDFIKYLNDNKRNWSILRKRQNDRIQSSITILFKGSNEAGNIIKGNLDNISLIELDVWWRDLRPRLAGNEGTGIHLSGDRENCDYFKKGINNEK